MTRQVRITGAVLHVLVGLTALVTGGAIFVIAVFLFISAWPAIVYNGWAFLTSITWNSGNQYGDAAFVTRHGVHALPGASFGILVFIAGTLLSSGIAMIFATPLAILTAVALVYQVPDRLKGITTTLVELMAGVPSVVFGLWGAIVLVPLIERLIPLFGTAGSGYGLITAAIILALMVLPIMAAMIRDLLLNVPQGILEGSIGLGATMWQTVARVALPSIGAGMVGAMLLALGRAFGETMAVLMVGGAASNALPNSLFAPINTMAAAIVSLLDSALTDPSGMSVASLAEVALALFAITLIVNLGARGIVRRVGGNSLTR